jgi:hypothetical protein
MCVLLARAAPDAAGAPTVTITPVAVAALDRLVSLPLAYVWNDAPLVTDAGEDRASTWGAPLAAAPLMVPYLLDGYGDVDEVVRVDPVLVMVPAGMRIRPLTELAPDVADLLTNAGDSVTAAVVVPSRETVYVANPDLAVPMASVVKLVIMLALFDAAEAEGRTVTPEEIALLDPMVTWSDNDNASLLWYQLGGGTGIDAYLQKVGASGILTDPWAWGDSRASGEAVALLLSRLAFGNLVSEEHRALALSLLSHVSEDQRWGVGTGVFAWPEGAVVGVKDGWYPVDAGWRAGSAGVLVPLGGDAPGATGYSIAVLTARNATLEDAIAVIQGIAMRVHAALYPDYVQYLPEATAFS